MTMKLGLLGIAALIAGAGCDAARCSEACDKIWEEDQCDVQVPGISQDMMNDGCVQQCVNALQTLGEVGDYDPDEPYTSGSIIELENREQAELWLDCVEERDCEAFPQGYCAPIG